MANNPSTLPDYNGQTNPPDADYLYGSARDDVSPGDLSGTPRVAAELNDVFGHQQAMLKAAAIVPSGSPDKIGASQHSQAVMQMVLAGSIFVDSGSADAYALSVLTDQIDIPAYKNGQRFTFLPDNDNTGASTVNVNGLGAKEVRTEDDAALVEGAIVTGRLTTIRYDLATDRFKLEQDAGVIGDSARRYRVVSCVLRQDTPGTGWYALDDAGHKPVGVSSVAEAGGDIVLNYNFTSKKIGSLQITPDEGYAATPLTMGASVGSTSANISMFHPFELRTAGTALAVQRYFGAEGVDWTATFDVGAGTLAITHAAQTHSDSGGYPVSVTMGDDVGNDQAKLSAVSKTGFTVAYMNRIAGDVSAAASPVVSTENQSGSSATWTGNNTLTITHPTCSQTDDVSVVSADPQYNCGVTASTTTSITVQFFDIATGLAYTGATPPAVTKYMRGSTDLSTIAGSTDLYIRRGPVKVDVTNVAGGTSNLWVFGVFEA